MKQLFLVSGLCTILLYFGSCCFGAEDATPNVQSSTENDDAIDSSSDIDTGAVTYEACIYGINNASCWVSLELSNWLREWHKNLKNCTEGDLFDFSHCQVSGEPWTSTFLRIAQNNTGGSGCTELNACLDAPPTSNDIAISDPEEAVRYRYVCYNIYAINFFFSSWYQGMYNAAIEAGDIVNKIIQAVDPPKKDFRIALTDVLSALSSGLVFLVIPEAAVISGAAAAIAPIFLKAIQQAPGIARIIWPEGSSQRESIEIAELYQNLGIVLQGLGPRIAGALAAVEGNDQSDVESFLAFAQDGYFSQPRDQWVNIANDTNGLLLGFTTFLASEALVLDGWHVEVALGVNPLQMSYTNATCPYWECDCGSFLDLGCSEFDNNSQCENNPWWYSNESNNSYTLSRDAYDGLYHPATHNEKDPTSIMQTIFNNGWSNGKLLLENAQTCVFDYSIQATYNTAELKTYLGEIFPSLNAVTFESDPCQHTNDSKGFWIKELQTGGLNLTRPNDTFYDADLSNSVPDPSPETRDWSCTTQLNLTVLEDWASVWYKHRHLT